MDVKKSKKKPELNEQLFVGNYIDVFHQGSKQHKLAYILSKSEKEIEITYDGISRKDNEIIKLSQNKINFARRFTINYTGDDFRQSKTSRDYLKYSRDECDKYIKELNSIMSNNFQGLSPIEICLSVRVRQFIWLDMVLSSEFQSKELPTALEYIKTYFNFIKWYFEQFPKYFADYMRLQNNQELYILDERASIAACLTEVCEAFCMLFGSIWRVLKQENSFFYLNYENLQSQLEKVFPSSNFQNFTTNPNIDDWNLYQGATDIVKCIKKTWPFYLRTMSYFKQIGGLQAWEGLLNFQDNAEYNYIPLKAMQRIVLTQKYLSQYFLSSEQAQMAKRTFEWLQNRVDNMSVQDIKDTDIDQVKDLTSDHQYYFQKGFTEDQLNRLTDEIQLQLSLKFLKSSFLEKRVKGISEIKDFTERLKFDQQTNLKFRSSISKDDLIKWIQQNKILDQTLLGDSVHPELIKRSSDVAVFLCRNQAFEVDYIDKIWINNYDKHETTQLALYEFFKTVSPYLSFQGIEKLYNHISTIPYSKYNENIVSMIKTFTESALSQRFHEQQLSLSPEKRFMTFNQLWELVQDREDQLTNSVIQEQCFQAARNIISQIPQTKQFISCYFGKCFELIGSHKSVYQAISFVHYFLDKQFKDDFNGKRELIQSTDDKYNIIELFVQDIEVYMEKVRQYFKNDIPQDIIINGVQKLSQNVFFRLQMLNYLLQQNHLRITYEQSVRLWDTLSAKTKGGIQKKELNKILITNYQMDTNQFRICPIYFDKEGESKFFKQVLCNPDRNDYENYTIEDFELFQVFFKQYNQSRQTLKYFNNLYRFLVNDHNFDGKQAIWNIFAQVKDQLLLEQISYFIINLYTQLNSNLDQSSEAIYQEMMDKCLDLIQQQCPSLTTRSINLLLQLFNYFQSGPPSKKSAKPINYTQFKVQIQQQNNMIKCMEFNEGDNTTINQWKQKLAEDLEVAYLQLDITIENKPIEQQFDVVETFVSQAFYQLATVKVRINNKNHPKNYLSQEQRTFEILFKLLDKQESIEFLSQVWDLINRLPINIMKKRQVENCKDWKQYLDHQFFDMFYVLQIIQTLLENEQWCEQFNNSDGVDMITERFLGQSFQFQQRPLEIKCFLAYLEILSHHRIRIKEAQFIEQIKSKIVESIQQFSLYVKTKKKIEAGQKKSSQQKEMNEVEFRLLRKCFQYLDQDGCKQYIKNSELNQQLYAFFVEHENHELKKEYGLQLLNLNNTPESKLLIKIVLEDVLKDVISNNKQKCDHFFEFCCNLIQQEQNLAIQKLNFEELLVYIRQKLEELPFNENTVKDQDQILIGLLKLLNVLIDRIQQLSTHQGLFEQILSYLFENEGETRCKCKSQQSRTAGFNCFFTLLKSPQNMQKFLNEVSPLHYTHTWRTKNFNDWNIQSRFHEKSSTGYVGLYNLGCICYMNSLLQQLYMVPAFREKLLQIEDKSTCAQEENLLHQLKCLFLALKHSQKQYHNPKKFCHAFKDFDGNPTNIFEQMDVDEFCNLLMDRIELNIKSTSEEDLVKRNFGGVISNEIIGKTCPHYSEREEPFFAISLPVANKKNLEECLQTLVQGDLLEGENAYSCEQCNKKVSALKRTCIKKLPDHLILVLKRFNFDFDLMAKAKINERIEFPFELDLLPYSQQGLRQQENRANPQNGQDNPSEYYQYRLTGVVIHIGSADSGHYYSFIQDRCDFNKWYEFNDIFVSSADVKDVKNDGFGGVDRLLKTKYPNQFKDKQKSAYMLFYERIKPINGKEELMDIEFDQKTSQFLDEIKVENRKFQIQRFIFSPEYFIFIQNLIKFELQSNQVSEQIVKTLVFFYLTCAVRENDKTFIQNNILDIQELLRRAPSTCEWLLKCFNQYHYIREFQFDCSKKMVRKFVISLIVTAIETVQRKEGYKVLDEYVDDKPKSMVASLINSWIRVLPDLKRSLKNSIEYYDLFYRFARLNEQNSQYLISKKIVGKLLDLFMDTMQINYSKLFIPYKESVRKQDDLKGIQFDEDPNSFLGQQNIQNVDIASNYYDELLEKKFEKSMNSGPSSSRVYMWRLIAFLLKTQGKNAFSMEEQNLLQFDNPILMAILEEGDCKLAIRMISDILSILSQDNQKQTEQIIQAIIKQINDKEYKEYRKYLVVLKRIFTVKDSLQQMRIHLGMSKLLEVMQKQSQYFFETDVCQQYILRMVFRNQAVYQWMVKNQRLWQWIIETNNTQSNPNEKLISNNSNSQKCNHRLHNIYLPITFQAYAKFLNWKKLQYLNLAKEPFKQNEDFDSDDDLTDKIVKVDDKIDYYDQNSWITATVGKVMGDYVHLTFSGKMAPQNIDIELDCERLAPFNTLSSNNKIPGILYVYVTLLGQNNQEMAIEHQSDHDNDTEEGNNNSINQTDSDEE